MCQLMVSDSWPPATLLPEGIADHVVVVQNFFTALERLVPTSKPRFLREYDMPDARAAIDANNRKFMTTFARLDAAGLARLYTPTGNVMPPNSDIIAGASNVQAFWEGVFGLGIREVVFDTIDVEGHGDTAIETGRYTLKVEGGAVADHGKYLIVWKNEGGTWKLHRDIFNTSQPAA